MKLIKLANGESLELNINFLTIKLLMKEGLFDKKVEDEDPIEQFNVAGKLIYAIMYSNGKKVTEEDALALVPIGDEESFFDLINEFQESMEKFKKKMESRKNLEKITK
jgi:hypothetical protein